MDLKESIFDRSLLAFKDSATSRVKDLGAANSAALVMLETYLPQFGHTNDGLLKLKRSADIDEFIDNNPCLSTYVGKLVNHRVDYVGDVGFAFLEAKPKSGYCGYTTLTFVAI